MKSPLYIIRRAELSDAPTLLALYAPYVNTSITFETNVPTLAEFEKRITTISARYPYLVAEIDGHIVGYAYAHEFKERAAYQWGSELSIYLDEQVHARGLGKKMYKALIEILRLQNIHTVYGIVTLPNEKSQRLHESLDFSLAGIMHKSGYKLGAWRDVAWYERAIAPYENSPQPFKPLSEISARALENILTHALD